MARPNEVQDFCPPINISPALRYPVLGATLQRSGGVNRHDAVVWGYARAADAMGVDIIQQCEVTNILVADGAVTAVETTRGTIRTEKVGCVTAGHTSVLAKMSGSNCRSKPSAAGVAPSRSSRSCRASSCQRGACLCEPVRQGRVVIGAGIDAYVSYTQRGSSTSSSNQMAALIELFPFVSRLR